MSVDKFENNWCNLTVHNVVFRKIAHRRLRSQGAFLVVVPPTPTDLPSLPLLAQANPSLALSRASSYTKGFESRGDGLWQFEQYVLCW